MKKQYLAALPLLLFLGLAIFLWRGLAMDPHILPSQLINKKLPHYDLIDKKLHGKWLLINVWASWCVSCRQEHVWLMQLKQHHLINLVGLTYKDVPLQTRQYLQKYGNPYAQVITDLQGKIALDWGVYGTPENFLVDGEGIVRYKYIGPITAEVWQQVVVPRITYAQ